MLERRDKIHKFRRGMQCAAHYGDIITWNDLENYLNETFYSALERWHLTNKWGLANGQIGWGNEPREYIEAISALESEKDLMEYEEMQKSMEKANKSSTSGKGKK